MARRFSVNSVHNEQTGTVDHQPEFEGMAFTLVMSGGLDETTAGVCDMVPVFENCSFWIDGPT